MSDLEKEIKSFRKSARRHYKNINNDPAWFVFGTLACWSIQWPMEPIELARWAAIIRLVAMVVILLFFGKRIFKGVSYNFNKTYPMHEKEFKNRLIASKLASGKRKRLNKMLDETIRSHTVSLRNTKHALPLYVSMAIWGTSLYVFIEGMRQLW